VARKTQAAQFAANVLPIIRDIQAAGPQASTPLPDSSTLASHPRLATPKLSGERLAMMLTGLNVITTSLA
jgi:hypothetical protein